MMLMIAGAAVGAISIVGVVVCVVMGLASRKRAGAKTDKHESL
jgi:hypothetical protein